MIFIVFLLVYYYYSYNIIIIDETSACGKHNQLLKEFEKKMSHYYPLGNDEFRIDHGKEYCNFFRRIGTMHMAILKDGGKIYGTGCAILRNINKCNVRKCWYICDLK